STTTRSRRGPACRGASRCALPRMPKMPLVGDGDVDGDRLTIDETVLIERQHRGFDAVWSETHVGHRGWVQPERRNDAGVSAPFNGRRSRVDPGHGCPPLAPQAAPAAAPDQHVAKTHHTP